MRRLRPLVLALAATSIATGQEDLERIEARLESEAWADRADAERDLASYCEDRGFEALPDLEKYASSSEGIGARGAFARWRDLLVRARERRNDVAVFDRTGWPGVRALPFIRIDQSGVGWLLPSAPDEIRLLRFQGREECWKRSGTEDKVLAYDYQRYCDEWVRGRLPKRILEPALLGYWAIERRHYRAGVALVEIAIRLATEDFRRELADQVARELRLHAIVDATQDASYEELALAWRTIAAIRPDPAEAAAELAIAASYDRYAEEERTWTDPGHEAVARLPVENRVRYWIRKIREQRFPGRIMMDVSLGGEEDSLFEGRSPTQPPTPVDRLREIGWPAIPSLIAHLDDSRPTRVAPFNMFGSDRLLDHGECCRQTIEQIAGVDLGGPDRTAARRTAEAWWRRVEPAGEERYYQDLLESDRSRHQRMAASRLLSIDERRHSPRILSLFESESFRDPEGIFRVLTPHLGPDERDFVIRQLDHFDPSVVVMAARVLHSRWGSVEGIAAVARRLEASNADEVVPYLVADSAVDLLAGLDPDVGVPVLCRLFAHPARFVAHAAIESSGRFPDPRVYDALVPLMAGRWRDVAADSIARLVGFRAPPGVRGSSAERARWLGDLEIWIAEHPDGLSAEELRSVAGR